MSLSRAQLNSAQRLLDRGLTLHEIAGRIDVSFEAVCLGLFGGNQSTEGKADVRNDDALAVDGCDGPEPGDGADVGNPGAPPTRPEPLPIPPSAGSATPDLREEGGKAGEPQGKPAAVAIAAVPGQRFRLVSEHGESLHENERVLTRLPKFFWRGDAAAVAALKARRPQWSRLSAVAVLSGSEATHAAH